MLAALGARSRVNRVQNAPPHGCSRRIGASAGFSRTGDVAAMAGRGPATRAVARCHVGPRVGQAWPSMAKHGLTRRSGPNIVGPCPVVIYLSARTDAPRANPHADRAEVMRSSRRCSASSSHAARPMCSSRLADVSARASTAPPPWSIPTVSGTRASRRRTPPRWSITFSVVHRSVRRSLSGRARTVTRAPIRDRRWRWSGERTEHSGARSRPGPRFARQASAMRAIGVDCHVLNA